MLRCYEVIYTDCRITCGKSHVNRKISIAGILIVLGGIFFAVPVFGQDTVEEPTPPGLDVSKTIQDVMNPENISSTLFTFMLLTVLTLAPAILVMTTSFTRLIVVLGFLRQAMATQQSPPNQVLVGLALFLTFFIMAPTYQRVFDEALTPYMEGEITDLGEATEKGLAPIREFMFKQVSKNPKDLVLFIEIAHLDPPNNPDDVPTSVLIPAFIIGEMRIAFQLGFIIYIPFLIIDMVVASTLMAMGMMMLPPVFVSLPFKIILFVLVDGWYLLIGSLVRSFY
ncbi:flagellar type III secretion system pore protein FliP [bacterium AH-315-P07]|nr:flagellar type III secretion system pore protein FliP [bacterium AH-315-P07]